MFVLIVSSITALYEFSVCRCSAFHDIRVRCTVLRHSAYRRFVAISLSSIQSIGGHTGPMILTWLECANFWGLSGGTVDEFGSCHIIHSYGPMWFDRKIEIILTRQRTGHAKCGTQCMFIPIGLTCASLMSATFVKYLKMLSIILCIAISQSAEYVKYSKIFGNYFWLIFIPTEDLGDRFLLILCLLKILATHYFWFYA